MTEKMGNRSSRDHAPTITAVTSGQAPELEGLIRPLNWQDAYAGEPNRDASAECPFGTYLVFDASGARRGFVVKLTQGSFGQEGFETSAAARAAGSADYERRVLACLNIGAK